MLGLVVVSVNDGRMDVLFAVQVVIFILHHIVSLFSLSFRVLIRQQR